jgi:DNA modification methylase
MIKEGLYNWDFEKGLKRVRADCVDLIFTDPPYIVEQWEHSFSLLAEGAAKY